MLDQSGSIGMTDFSLVKTFVANLVMELDVDGGQVRVGALAFSTGVELLFHLDDYVSR